MAKSLFLPLMILVGIIDMMRPITNIILKPDQRQK